MTCDQIRELAADVALDIADGEQRALVLRHISTCAECRRLVESLSEVADELLVLAPVQEPPVGFESRVIDRLGLGRTRRWRPRRIALRVAPALAAAAVTAVALVAAFHDDRVTADRYRATLDEAQGQSFDATPLVGAAGERAGVAFGYQGSPSWVFFTVDRAHRRDVSAAELVTTRRRAIKLARFRLGSDGTWGGAIPVDLHEVASVRLLGKRPGQVLQAYLRKGAAGD